MSEETVKNTILEEDVVTEEAIESSSTPAEETSPESSLPEEGQKDREYFQKAMTRMKRELMKNQATIQTLHEKLQASEQTAAHMGHSALESYKANALNLLEKAKIAKKQAHELSDIDSMIQADEDMASAAAQLQWAQTIPSKVPVSTEESKPNKGSHPEESVVREPDPALLRWVRQNPWIDESSVSYDEEKAGEVVAYASKLETELAAKGQDYVINTPAYFRALERYARYIDGQRGDIKNMKKDVSMAAPLSSLPSKSKTKEEMTKLTPEEKELCDAWGISEDAYLKARIQDRQDQILKLKYRGEGRYGR